MGRAIGGILGSIAGRVIGFAIGGPIGAAIGTVVGAYAGSEIGNAIAPARVPKPDTTETSVKLSRPPRVKAYGVSRLYGASACFETVNGTTVDVWAFADTRARSVLRTYLNDDQVTVSGGVVQALSDKSYQGGNVRLGYSLGRPTETAFAAVTALLPEWGANHRGDGVVAGYLLKNAEKDKYILETYPQGDNVQLSLVAEWTPTFDPRDPAQSPYDPETWTFSENAVRAFVHYLMVERKFDWDTRFEPQRARIIAAINDADQAMALAGGGTEPRYRTALSYKATEAPEAIIGSLLACFDGWYVINERREVVLYSGRFYTPTVSIGPDETVTYSHQIGVGDEDYVNTIAVPYVSALHDYNTVDGQAWTDEDDIASRGKENSAELGAVVPSHTQGRRLAKRRMSRNNAADRGSVTTTYAGRGVLEQRYINLRLEEAGAVFFDGVAEVIAAERNMETGGVSFDWVAADPNIDAWNPDTEDGEGAPVGARYAPEPLARPTITSAQAIYTEATDAGTGARLSIEAAGPGLDGLTWYSRWRRDSSSVWVEQQYPDEDPGVGVTLLTGFVPIAPSIQVQVEYRSSDGRLSGWSDTMLVDTRTDVTVPGAATVISVASWADALSLVTDRIPRATTYRWRIYAADGTTLIRTLSTTSPQVAYSAAQAAADGARRSYVVRVAGLNGAGAGAEASTGTITLPAPVAVANVAATGGASEAQVTFDLPAVSGIAGYLIPVSTTANFDPLTQGTIFRSLGSPAYLQALASGTFYTKVAAYDAWTDRPDLLNFSAETSFVITTGGGGVGGGGGGGGGGYCPDVDTLVLLADDARTGPGDLKRAGDLAAGDWVWTQHEFTLAWGAYEIEAVSIARCRVWTADIGVQRMRATRGHRVWLGSGWMRFDAIGRPGGRTNVAKITVRNAHTYVANGVLNHNIKQFDPEP
ncbi:MAG: hypothetical protein FJ335_03755 [Sphingomonadales bacterium]|nr:hypothetical protein [Sphingomonadales bacterium]